MPLSSSLSRGDQLCIARHRFTNPVMRYCARYHQPVTLHVVPSLGTASIFIQILHITRRPFSKTPSLDDTFFINLLLCMVTFFIYPPLSYTKPYFAGHPFIKSLHFAGHPFTKKNNFSLVLYHTPVILHDNPFHNHVPFNKGTGRDVTA